MGRAGHCVWVEVEDVETEYASDWEWLRVLGFSDVCMVSKPRIGFNSVCVCTVVMFAERCERVLGKEDEW